MYTSDPLPLTQVYPGALHAQLFLATQFRTEPTKENENNFVCCNTTDNIRT